MFSEIWVNWECVPDCGLSLFFAQACPASRAGSHITLAFFECFAVGKKSPNNQCGHIWPTEDFKAVSCMDTALWATYFHSLSSGPFHIHPFSVTTLWVERQMYTKSLGKRNDPWKGLSEIFSWQEEMLSGSRICWSVHGEGILQSIITINFYSLFADM